MRSSDIAVAPHRDNMSSSAKNIDYIYKSVPSQTNKKYRLVAETSSPFNISMALSKNEEISCKEIKILTAQCECDVV